MIAELTLLSSKAAIFIYRIQCQSLHIPFLLSALSLLLSRCLAAASQGLENSQRHLRGSLQLPRV